MWSQEVIQYLLQTEKEDLKWGYLTIFAPTVIDKIELGPPQSFVRASEKGFSYGADTS